MTARIIVTGSRGWSDLDVMVAALVDAWRDLGKPTRPVLVHGACRGADTMAAQLWRLWKWPTEPHPADWSRFGDLAGPRRNAAMVAGGADLCLAFPTPGSRGTWDCVRRAETAGIPVRVHQPTTDQEAA